ncbi:tyrosinase family protein [Hymenobacter sp. BT635]|uniref:Tyrosinase family protein n=1 Tax=Hymenobacter nitidus TaxID=2880929 RepID=A0ABS8ACT9_9BACT|nr:tyrosinase family protein [Hymenobacter nitidus]MCB2378221.1 tyrosinase family protein [Hymenobacter nitidus]
MTSSSPIRIRRSIVELQTEYDAGNTKPLDDLMRAWKGIKELDYTNLKSFFNLAGYHGEPFRGPGQTNGTLFWGGYCNHGNVLFPTWHRAHCLKIEEALQSIPGCADVMLPYWDETADETLAYGMPKALTDEFYTLDGVQIPNPLRSFTFPIAISDQVAGDNVNDPNNPSYSKPAGYETVRYPLAGLVGTPTDQAATTAHNAKYPNYDTNVKLLNANLTQWLGKDTGDGIYQKFHQCLLAPNYTVFSNTTSAQEWNHVPANKTLQVTPLEEPHNDIHLAMGGFEAPYTPDPSFDAEATGDMGENDTAGLDPMFYFHHCNIDRVFWLWQQAHQATEQLEIIEYYPGTNSSDSQGATPGIAPNTSLTLDTPLNPFKKGLNNDGPTYISRDCINIETQMGYTYSKGSLGVLVDTLTAGQAAAATAVETPESPKTLHVSRINKAPIKGSFVVVAYAHHEGKKEVVGYKSVLNRWDSGSCANCQTHLEVKAAFRLPTAVSGKLLAGDLTADDFSVELITRKQPQATLLAALALKKPHRLELR